MLFENYKDNIVYNSQSAINFPKRGKETDRAGTGSALFLLTPNRDKCIEFINDPAIKLQQSLTKRIVTDCIFRDKIGAKRITSLERGSTDKFFMKSDMGNIRYIPYASRNSVLSKRMNVINDLSRWMEIFFSRTTNMSPKKICMEFIRILKARLNDPLFVGYTKTLVIDVNSWTDNIKKCVIMNKKLLDNPISIILYSAVYYPHFLEDFPDIRFMLISRASHQLYFIQSSMITKKFYPKIKSKLSTFKSLIFSVEDEILPNDNEEEIKSEINTEIAKDIKSEIIKKMRKNLLGDSNEVEDITDDLAIPIDELEKELDGIPDDESETEDEETDIETSINDEITKSVDEALDNIEDLDEVNIEDLTAELSSNIKRVKFQAAFVPERSEKEKARIERLTVDQKKALGEPTLDDVKRKTLSSKSTGSYIKTSNPNILSSKFANFDKEYTEKCLEKNIDDSVAILSQADEKIFVTNKTVKDSSTPMDLKETYTYELEDEYGTKMKLSFDVPKIVDNSYVYLNGTKKNIRHQFILKPIVKTSPDTVQIVTAYNKVFIRRLGAVNQNINKISTYLNKNTEKFRVKTGNCSMQNESYILPLDFSMLSKYFAEFTVRDVTFYMAVDILMKRYQVLNKKPLTYDTVNEIPIGINNKTKEAVMLKLTDSYTDFLYNYFNPEDKVTISKLKRKPRYIVASAKIMGRNLPIILFMMFCEGFAKVMEKANIEYKFVDAKELKQFDPMHYDSIKMNDGFIVWKKDPFRNELLMNGFKYCNLEDFNYEDLESKDTFISLILPFYPGNAKIHNALDNYKDFLLDEKAKEILTDFGYPTDLTSLLIVAAGMLTDTNFLIENNLNNMRIRSNEVIADLVYKDVTAAYSNYRTGAKKKGKKKRISMKKSQIIDDLLNSDTNMIEEFSALNPVLELEKQRSVTFKGIRGIQLDRAMTLPRRAYDRSMIGTVGMATSPDANVGVVRAMTLEPQIKSTYGYIDTSKDVSELNSANLFTVSELLNPLGAMHDDPDRTAMDFCLFDVAVKPR